MKRIKKIKLKTEQINVGNMKPINPVKLEQKQIYFEKYGIFKENIIVDENNKLIDGFSSILIAVDYGIRKVECIKIKKVKKVKNTSKVNIKVDSIELINKKTKTIINENGITTVDLKTGKVTCSLNK